MAGHGDLAAAAEGMPIDGRDDGLGEALDAAQDGVAKAEKTPDIGSREGRAQIGAGAEDLVSRPRDDQALHAGVRLQLGQGGVRP
jgi:hypothetical protein